MVKFPKDPEYIPEPEEGVSAGGVVDYPLDDIDVRDLPIERRIDPDTLEELRQEGWFDADPHAEARQHIEEIARDEELLYSVLFAGSLVHGAGYVRVLAEQAAEEAGRVRGRIASIKHRRSPRYDL